MNMELQLSDEAYSSTNTKKEMDLIELVSSSNSQLSQGSNSSFFIA
jgi:hypothetical protein